METKKKPATKKKPSKYDEKFIIHGTPEDVLKASFKKTLPKK